MTWVGKFGAGAAAAAFAGGVSGAAGTITLVRFGAMIAGSGSGAVIAAGIGAIKAGGAALWLAAGADSGKAGGLVSATGWSDAAVA
ncbi:MAG: hypothetical protein ABWY27_19110, partial [Telluria sp.]